MMFPHMVYFIWLYMLFFCIYVRHMCAFLCILPMVVSYVVIICCCYMFGCLRVFHVCFPMRVFDGVFLYAVPFFVFLCCCHMVFLCGCL